MDDKIDVKVLMKKLTDLAIKAKEKSESSHNSFVALAYAVQLETYTHIAVAIIESSSDGEQNAKP